MKQFTDSTQTAVLVGLGLPKPKSVCELILDLDMDYTPSFAYSIGELLEMIENKATIHIRRVATKNKYRINLHTIGNNGRLYDGEFTDELLDALFDVVVELRKEKVI